MYHVLGARFFGLLTDDEQLIEIDVPEVTRWQNYGCFNKIRAALCTRKIL